MRDAHNIAIGQMESFENVVEFEENQTNVILSRGNTVGLIGSEWFACPMNVHEFSNINQRGGVISKSFHGRSSTAITARKSTGRYSAVEI